MGPKSAHGIGENSRHAEAPVLPPPARVARHLPRSAGEEPRFIHPRCDFCAKPLFAERSSHGGANIDAKIAIFLCHCSHDPARREHLQRKAAVNLLQTREQKIVEPCKTEAARGVPQAGTTVA